MNFVNQKLEEFERYIRNRKVAIIGLGVSNIPLIDYFTEKGSIVTVFDNRKVEEIDENILEKIQEKGINYSFGENSLVNLVGFDLIFRAPSCRPDTPELYAEAVRGAIITTEIEMLIELCPGLVIGVTGTNGKTTTASLIYEIVKEKGYECYLGGNIGIPLFTKVGEMSPNCVCVLELSSFQLMDIKISPQIAVITNISPNHLDVHKSYEEYIDCKKNIFRFQDKEGLVILNYDNEVTKPMVSEVNGKLNYFSVKNKLDDGVIFDNGILKNCVDGIRRHILTIDDAISLKGMHNYENICAAIAATSLLVEPEIQARAITKFTGVEHRLEFVKTVNGVKWYNDSIGTTPTRTIAGLNAFEEPIVLIAGGYDKNLDYEVIAKPILKKACGLVLIGETADKIQEAVEKQLELNRNDPMKCKLVTELPIYKCNNLEEAVNKANEIANENEIVLFSPASASFDMFKNFAERGEKFKELVNKL